jgi:hypothetical protein
VEEEGSTSLMIAFLFFAERKICTYTTCCTRRRNERTWISGLLSPPDPQHQSSSSSCMRQNLVAIVCGIRIPPPLLVSCVLLSSSNELDLFVSIVANAIPSLSLACEIFSCRYFIYTAVICARSTPASRQLSVSAPRHRGTH